MAAVMSSLTADLEMAESPLGSQEMELLSRNLSCLYERFLSPVYKTLIM